MNAIEKFFHPILEKFGGFIPNVVAAIIVLAVGWILIVGIRKGLEKILSLSGLNERLSKSTDHEIKLEQFITSLVYYVLLVFLFLLVLEILQVDGVLAPVLEMFSTLLTALPNIIAAGIIGLLGYVLAKIFSRVVETVASPLDIAMQKSGIAEKYKISALLGQVVFIVILVPTLVAALDKLQIAAISEPAKDMLNEFLTAVPSIIAAALIVLLAFFIGKLVVSMLTGLLRQIGTDELPKSVGLGGVLGDKSLSDIIGKVAFVFIMLFALMVALGQLGFVAGEEVLMRLIVFAANILLGVVIIVIGNRLAAVAADAVGSSQGGVPFLAMIVRAAVLVLALAIGLHAMGFANEVVILAFGFLFGAVAVAFALAFGLGGREAAGKHLDHMLSKLRKGD